MNDWIPCEKGYPSLDEQKNFIITDKNGRVVYDVVYGYMDGNVSEPGFYYWSDWDEQYILVEAVAWCYELEPYKG